MPLYEYRCNRCGRMADQRRAVDQRDEERECGSCWYGVMERRFSLPLLIEVPEHFRHLQSQFLPAKEDKQGWEGLATRADLSQMHGPKPEPSLSAHLKEDLGLTRERIVTSRV